MARAEEAKHEEIRTSNMFQVAKELLPLQLLHRYIYTHNQNSSSWLLATHPQSVSDTNWKFAILNCVGGKRLRIILFFCRQVKFGEEGEKSSLKWSNFARETCWRP